MAEAPSWPDQTDDLTRAFQDRRVVRRVALTVQGSKSMVILLPCALELSTPFPSFFPGSIRWVQTKGRSVRGRLRVSESTREESVSRANGDDGGRADSDNGRGEWVDDKGVSTRVHQQQRRLWLDSREDRPLQHLRLQASVPPRTGSGRRWSVSPATLCLCLVQGHA